MKYILMMIFLISTSAIAANKLEKKSLKKAMENEKKYAKEQKFYQGSEYNLKEKEVEPGSLKHIKNLEPEYDFDMDDVYD